MAKLWNSHPMFLPGFQCFHKCHFIYLELRAQSLDGDFINRNTENLIFLFKRHCCHLPNSRHLDSSPIQEETELHMLLR